MLYMFFVFFITKKLKTIGTLIVESLERQIVGVLIVRFLEHQQRNVNLQKGSSNSGGPIASLMIKSAKNEDREKRIGVVRIAYLPQWGIFPTYRVQFMKIPSVLLGIGFYLLLVQGRKFFFPY